jgi:hypothetical protein
LTLLPGTVTSGAGATITVGGHARTFHIGDNVTPAELLAIYEVQSGGQTIVLDSRGRADGGSFSLNSAFGGAAQIDGLTVPKNVTAIDYLSSSSSINVKGDLLNYGAIQDVSNGGQVSANISAINIVNERSGSITTTSKDISSAAPDLVFNAVQDFTNLGTVNSGGALTISAGGSILNGLTAGSAISASSQVHSTAMLGANNNVVLQSLNIVNTGTITSAGANITASATANQVLSVNNTAGIFSAQNGAINIRDAAYTGSADTNISGGNFLSQQVNLNAGGGTLNFNADDVTGVVNSSGNAVHVAASTSNLVLGSQCLTGDPTYFNDKGDITITADINTTEDLAIIASGNIIAKDNTVANIIATNGVGHNVTLIAGAHFSSTSGSSTTTIPGANGTAVALDGGSTTGGSIDLSAANSNLLISSAGTSDHAGGILLAAFAGTDANSGRVVLPAGSNLNASSTFGNGPITIIAGGNSKHCNCAGKCKCRWQQCFSKHDCRQWSTGL